MSVNEKKEHSQAFLRQRKMMLVMPLLVVPFVTLGFWSLGGGRGPLSTDKVVQKGFNTQLPAPENLSDSTFDKMAFYKKAEKDSLERMRRIHDDPYYQMGGPSTSSSMVPDQPPGSMTGYSGNTSYSGYSFNDPNERRLSEKLAQLNSSLNTAPNEYPPAQVYGPPYTSTGVTSADIDRLEKMITAMQNTGNSGQTDPEMQQINDVLGQILDIQHPERVTERLQQSSSKHSGMVFPVTGVRQYNPVSLLMVNQRDTADIVSAGFYSIEDQQEEETQNAIAAAVYETQTLVSGSIVKLRLLNDVYVSGQLIPKDNFLFGVAEIRGERLSIGIKSLRYQHAIFPVNLAVYDVDGLDGIYIPGAISRDVSKESSDRAIQSLGMTSLDPSMSAQAMGAGIEAMKSLMSKKVKLVKVTVKAGYQVLLKDINQKNQP